MAVYAGAHIVNNLQISLWLDPNRWRAMIYRKSANGNYSLLVRRMHDKDGTRIYQRAVQFAQTYQETA